MKLRTQNLNSLPALPIVQTLTETFSIGSSEAQSSHWKHYANKSQVALSADGILKNLEGIGFGNYSSDPTQPIMGILNYLTYVSSWSLSLSSVLRQLRDLVKLSVPIFPYDSLRHAALASFLLTHSKSILATGLSEPRICIIGDGWGLLSALLKVNLPSAKITVIDLGKTLTFSSLFLQDRFPRSSFELVQQGVIEPRTDFTFIPAENIQSLECPKQIYDLTINVASMQEMDATWVRFYFKWTREALKPRGHFYCCNRELKTLPDGTISEFALYPWAEMDRILVDEYPEFYRWFFSLGKTKRQVSIGPFKVPFMRLFDGDHRHRLVEMAELNPADGSTL